MSSLARGKLLERGRQEPPSSEPLCRAFVDCPGERQRTRRLRRPERNVCATPQALSLSTCIRWWGVCITDSRRGLGGRLVLFERTFTSAARSSKRQSSELNGSAGGALLSFRSSVCSTLDVVFLLFFSKSFGGCGPSPEAPRGEMQLWLSRRRLWYPDCQTKGGLHLGLWLAEKAVVRERFGDRSDRVDGLGLLTVASAHRSGFFGLFWKKAVPC